MTATADQYHWHRRYFDSGKRPNAFGTNSKQVADGRPIKQVTRASRQETAQRIRCAKGGIVDLGLIIYAVFRCDPCEKCASSAASRSTYIPINETRRSKPPIAREFQNASTFVVKSKAYGATTNQIAINR